MHAELAPPPTRATHAPATVPKRAAPSPAPAQPAVAEQGHYLWDRREFEFVLWEFFRVESLHLGHAPFEAATRGDVQDLLDRAASHAGRLSAAYVEADRDRARLDADGQVHIAPAFRALWPEHKRDWFAVRNQGDSIHIHDRAEKRYPPLVTHLINEMFSGANASFMTLGAFTPAAATVVRYRGTEYQKQLLLDKLERLQWDACFCATEVDAGSDLMGIATTGQRIDGEVYSVVGEKLYITAGMHALTENTVYLVLGRAVGAGASPLALSCFLVPRLWTTAEGSLVDNHVECVHVEDKMGLNGCPNTRLRFGHGGTTRGLLLGGSPNVALLQLAMLMRKARVGTGSIAVAIASSAYLHALRYARQRVQGRPYERASDLRAAPVPIIEHHDVQRMLLAMKAQVEGSRLLMGRIAFHSAQMQQILYAQDGRPGPEAQAKLDRHGRLVMLFAPVAKAYISDEAWNVATTAMQVHGAVGYLRDLPLEQYLRDLKVLTIWEGTNYIQAQDLLRDKLASGRDLRALDDLREDIGALLDQESAHPGLQAEFGALRDALAHLERALQSIAQHAAAGRGALTSQFATRFLGMLGDVLVGWNLLEAACVAWRALAAGPVAEADTAFYRGKLAVARFFCHNVLPGVATRADIIGDAEHAHVALPSADFGFAP